MNNTIERNISMKELFDQSVNKLADLYNKLDEEEDKEALDKIKFEISAIHIATKSMCNKLYPENEYLN